MRDLGRLTDAVEALLKVQARSNELAEQVLGRLDAALQRDGSHEILDYDTTTANRPKVFNMRTILGDAATSLSILSVGGGGLEVSINGERFFSAAAGAAFENEVIETVTLRVSTGAAGTAQIRVGAPPPKGPPKPRGKVYNGL